MTDEEISRFIDDNCHGCSRQKPLMPRARCDIWKGLESRSPVTLSIMHRIANTDGSCKYWEPKA